MNEPSTFEMVADGGVITISFITNRYWKINCSESWVNVSPSSGFGSDSPISVTIRCETNRSFEERKGTLVITVPDLRRTVKISQEANEGIFAIDLGLSVLWASCNIGAPTPWDYGNYYAWGEISTKTSYSWDTYLWCTDYFHLTKYNYKSSCGVVDNKMQLDASDDVAQVLVGDKWRMPNRKEIEELVATQRNKKYQWTFKSVKGQDGWEVLYLSNGNSLFFPLAGEWNGEDVLLKEKRGYYWTSSLGDFSPENGILMRMTHDIAPEMIGFDRSRGYPVRPVKPKS